MFAEVCADGGDSCIPDAGSALWIAQGGAHRAVGIREDSRG